jgi:hypothetical protein
LGGPADPALILSPATLAQGKLNAAYSQTITAGGGTGTVTLSVDPASIQAAIAGLTVAPSADGTSVAVSGTPTATGTETFTVTATDSTGGSASSVYSLYVSQSGAEQFKPFGFISRGSFSGSEGAAQNSTTYSGTATVQGAMTFTSPTYGTWQGTASGSGNWSDSGSGHGTFMMAGHGGGSYDNGVFTCTASLDSSTGLPVQAGGPYSFAGTFDTSNFGGSLGWNTAGASGSWSGTLAPTSAQPFAVAISPAWTPTGISVGVQVAGPPQKVASPSTPVTSVQLYWAKGPAAGQIMGSALPESIPIWWNLAGVTENIDALPSVPAGAKDLLLIAKYNGQTVVSALPVLTATIDKATHQPDPTNQDPVSFTVVFSEPVQGFTGSDVTLSGTADPVSATVTAAGSDQKTYNVAVSGMTAYGTVLVQLAADAVLGADNAPNAPSTSPASDNTVTYDTLSLSPGTLPADTVGAPYHQKITAGGAPGTITLSVSDIQGTIPGLTVPANGIGSLVISGTPTATGTESFTVTATASSGGTVSTDYSVTVNGAVSLSPAKLPPDTANVAYQQTISASGGTGTISLKVTNLAGAILGLNVPTSGTGSLVISGTPTAAGTETFTVVATDSAGATSRQNYSITVNKAVALGPATLPADTVNTAYQQTITASGGTGAVTLAVDPASIQGAITGLTVPASGTGTLAIGGTPTATGTETFTVDATDSLGGTTSATYSITVNPAIVLSPAELPADTVNIQYQQTITAGGGTGKIGLRVSNLKAAIPGLTVPAKGTGSLAISGLPTAAGTETFTITATDSAGGTTSTDYSITVNKPITLGAAKLPSGTVNVAYQQLITANGGTGTVSLVVDNIVHAVSGLVVPPQSTGTLDITGTPTAAGTETFTVTATDSVGASKTETFTITVNPSPAHSPAADLAIPLSPAVTDQVMQTQDDWLAS